MCKNEYIGMLNTLVWESCDPEETYNQILDIIDDIAYNDDITNKEYLAIVEYANMLCRDDLNIDSHITI